MTVAFDTLKLARRLEAAGFSMQQAQDTAEALAETLTATVATQGDVRAVQADIRELELRLRAEIRDVEGRLHSEIVSLGAELRVEMAGLRIEMQSLRAELIKWVIGVGIAAFLAVGGMMLTLGIAILRALPHP